MPECCEMGRSRRRGEGKVQKEGKGGPNIKRKNMNLIPLRYPLALMVILCRENFD